MGKNNQIYGQLRTQRYQESSDAAIDRIATGVDRIGAGVKCLAAALIEEEEEGEEEGKRARRERNPLTGVAKSMVWR